MSWIVDHWPFFAIPAIAALVLVGLLYLQAWLRFCHRRKQHAQQSINWPSVIAHLKRGDGTLVGFVRDGVCFAFAWRESSLDKEVVENSLDTDDWTAVFPPPLYVFLPRLVKRKYRNSRVFLFHGRSVFS